MTADNRTVLEEVERPGIDRPIEERLDMALVLDVLPALPQFHEGFLYDILRLIVTDKTCGIEGKSGVRLPEYLSEPLF